MVCWDGVLISGHLHSVVRQVVLLSGFSTVTEAETFSRTVATSSRVDKGPAAKFSKETR